MTVAVKVRARQVLGRGRVAFDRLLPDRPVKRTVRGVEMVLPRRHLLPYFAIEGSVYAQNLIDLAVALGYGGDLVVLDIGANVGDSALLIRDRVDGAIVCVEGDPQWLSYLETNVGSLDGVEIEPSLLMTPEDSGNARIVHADVGSSRLEISEEPTGIAAISTDELLERHPVLAGVRLIKTDTDGFDVKLTPALAARFAPSRPVIFLEFDPVPTRMTTPELEPADVWAKLEALGYVDAVVWTNGGALLGSLPVAELIEKSLMLESGATLPYAFWDVAVAHRDDEAGRAALRSVVAGVPVAPWS